MKKTIVMLLLACLVLSLCAACGKTEEPAVSISESFATPTPEPTAEPTPEPEVTEEPAATPEPEETEPEETKQDEEKAEPTQAPAPQNNSNSNSNSNTNPAPAPATPAPTAEPTPSPNPKQVALGLINQDVNALYAAIGQPNSSSYSTSCLTITGGQDGLLFYDGFEVATFREPSGYEYIRDIY